MCVCVCACVCACVCYDELLATYSELFILEFKFLLKIESICLHISKFCG